MNAHTQRLEIAGPAGALACAQDEPHGAPSALLVVCHPHPLHGGTMDNKVVQTIARAGLQLGWRVLRFNFRGVGGSAGAWDEGRGEVDDALAVIAAGRAGAPGLPLMLAGFSFGGYVATAAAARLIYSGVKNQKTGREIPGLLPGSELGWTDTGWTASARATGLDQFRFIVFADPRWTVQQFNAGADIARADEGNGNIVNALEPNLKPFIDRGGKLIQYHGWIDQLISPNPGGG